MAALVTMQQAKDHLYVTTSDHDADIDRKIQEASDIVIDYLKFRGGVWTTIDTSSVDDPTVITTDEAHGWTNSQIVRIDGHVDSVPPLDGTHVIANVTASSFTIPMAVTEAGTGGTVTADWTTANVPKRVQSAVLLMLSHLYEHRGDDLKTDEDLWLAIERLLMRSRDPALA